MGLKERIIGELTPALKRGDELRVSVLRMLAAAIHNQELEKRRRSGEAKEAILTDEEVMQVIRQELKKRTDAAEAYQRGGRHAAARQEQAEADILGSFLPKELSDAELEEIIRAGQKELGIASAKEFGKLMGWVMGRLKGQASGERVAALIRRNLAAA